MELNKIYNEDCLERMKKIDDNSIDLIVTDPPYKVTPKGSCGTTGGMLKAKITRQGKVFKYNNINIEDYINEFYRILKEDTHCYIMTNNYNLHHFLNVIKDSKLKLIKPLIWKKNNVLPNQWYMDCYEYILLLRKGKAKKINNCGTKSILEINNVRNKSHPTEKPLDLMKILIDNSSEGNDVIFDPFAGSGSTLVASKELGRMYIGCEIDKEYYYKILKRIGKFDKTYYEELPKEERPAQQQLF